jgi:hypothetical protein
MKTLAMVSRIKDRNIFTLLKINIHRPLDKNPIRFLNNAFNLNIPGLLFRLR